MVADGEQWESNIHQHAKLDDFRRGFEVAKRVLAHFPRLNARIGDLKRGSPDNAIGMSLDNLHSNYSAFSELNDLNTQQVANSYLEARNNFIKLTENAVLWAGNQFQAGIDIQVIHSANGHATLGYGFDLGQQNYNDIQTLLTRAFGGALTADQQAGLQIISDFKQGAITEQHLIDIAQGDSGTLAEQTSLQSIRLFDAEATILLNDILDGVHIAGYNYQGYEETLSLGFGATDDVPESLERLAMLSADYNASLIGPRANSQVM